jgi:hypothetical protein
MKEFWESAGEGVRLAGAGLGAMFVLIGFGIFVWLAS